MGKRLLIVLFVLIIGVFGYYYFTRSSDTQQSYSQQSYSQQSYSGQSSSGNTIQYYLRYYNGIEWVIVPPGQFNSNQTTWIEYPYGLDQNSNGSYNIVGQWERVSSTLTVFIPTSTPSYSQSDNYNVSAARARTMVDQQWQSIDNAPDYSQAGYENPCSGSTDCVDTSAVSGDSSDTSEP